MILTGDKETEGHCAEEFAVHILGPSSMKTNILVESLPIQGVRRVPFERPGLGVQFVDQKLERSE